MYYEKYVEVFGGGGWILFAKPPNNDFEVFNDANSNIQILFHKVIDILNRILYNIDTEKNLISYLNRNLEEDNILLKKYRFCFDIFWFSNFSDYNDSKFYMVCYPCTK